MEVGSPGTIVAVSIGAEEACVEPAADVSIWPAPALRVGRPPDDEHAPAAAAKPMQRKAKHTRPAGADNP